MKRISHTMSETINKPTRAEQSRINGGKSQGPITPEGKAISSRNSLKHGFAAIVNVVLRIEDKEAFTEHLTALRNCYKPRDYAEQLYVDQLAAITWRQSRLGALETALVDAQTGLQFDSVREIHPQASSDPYFHLVQAWQGLARQAQKLNEDPALPPAGYDKNSAELLNRYQNSLNHQHRDTLLNLTLYRKHFAPANPAPPLAPEPIKNAPKQNEPKKHPLPSSPPTANHPTLPAIHPLILVTNTKTPPAIR